MMNHIPRKRFGQNFLQDKNMIRKIVRVVHPEPYDNLVEVGPGYGALTKEILPIVKKMHVIEIDRDVIHQLKINCLDLGELVIHQGDVLKFNFNTLFSQKKLRIIGNLPYNISTPLLFHFIDFKPIVQDMHFMLQKEVVDRMTAAPNHKSYGRLSVMLQYHFQINHLFDVPPTVFYPQPKVESAIARLIPITEPPLVAVNYELFSTIVREAFNQRRKTIANALKNFITKDIFEHSGINANLRAENLSVQDFVKLTNATGFIFI